MKRHNFSLYLIVLTLMTLLLSGCGTSGLSEEPALSEAEGECWRYDRINQRLTETEGQITTQSAIDLLADVSQESTQWSVVYGMSSGDINVAMGQEYDDVHIVSAQ